MARIDVYVKVVKNIMPSFGHEYQKASMEAVAADYVDFLEELLERTPRPSKDLLIKSARKVHPEVTPEAINSWASKMIDVISHLRAKAKSSTSMTKINPKIKCLVKLLKKIRDSDPSPSPEALNSRYPRRNSSTSSLNLVEEEVTSGRSLGSHASRAEIFAAYGLPEKPKKALTLAITDDVYEVEDSQDTEKVSNVKVGVALQWFDAVQNCMMRRMDDGTMVSAKMLEGDKGFLLAVFDGEAPVETEVPNMVLLPTVFKRPAAKKRPAAASKTKSKKKVAAPAPEEHGDVEADEDEGDDDEGAEEEAVAEASSTYHPKVFFRYSNPYVYPSGRVAIRRAGPDSKKEVCGILSTLPVDRTKTIMSRLTKLLNDGKLPEADAKNWLIDNVK
jgi:hypothetical protein